MKSNKLNILYKTSGGEEAVRCSVEKWTFQDKAMSVGSQFVTFSVFCERPIDFAVGDYCVYRGQKFYLNNLPSVDQTARPNEAGHAFKYDNVRLDSVSNDLGRVVMLDITPTTGDYIAALGTNYSGSSNFQLYCGEKRATVFGKEIIYTPVCTLAGKIQANLDRAFPKDGWHVHVNLATTKVNKGKPQLVTHTDDKVLSFNNTTVAAALSEVQTTFKLDYFIKGRDIYIGYTLGAITGEDFSIGENGGDNGYFYLGYGKGYADKNNQGKALFEIKKNANQSQQIITRLRAMGSAKNMPYRYYNKKYNLPQALFPQNLQLPDTFEKPEIKSKNNIARKEKYPYLRAVLGDTNDAYIDKNDDCFASVDGLREGSAQWDGTNQDLEEIFPTIKEATYGELRGAFCKDIDGFTESKGTTPDGDGNKSYTNYKDLERIDEILAVGYLGPNGQVVDDAHVGNGIMSQDGASNYPHQDLNSAIPLKTVPGTSMKLEPDGQLGCGEQTLFVIQDQSAGRYFMAASHGNVWVGAKLLTNRFDSCTFGYRLKVYITPKSTSAEYLMGTYTVKNYKLLKKNDGAFVEFELPHLPDVKENEPQIREITLSETSDVRVTFELLVSSNIASANSFSITYFVGNSENKPSTVTNYKPQYRWAELQYDVDFSNRPFHIIIKDLGIPNFNAQFTGKDKPTVVMSDGYCVARGFEIGDDVQKVTIHKGGKAYKGWQLSLTRASDTSLHTYYPSISNKIQAGDHYVLTGIEMPDVYVKAAEMRLLVAATQYLADNCEIKYTYEPHLDDIYLVRNYDRCEEEGDVTKSVYWNLYAGLRFPFYGIPNTDDPKEILPIVNITIESLTIKEGDGSTPRVEITLNDKIQQTTYQKITTAVDRIYNGSLFAQMGIGGGLGASDVEALIRRLGTDLFVHKDREDTAQKLITFLEGIAFKNGNGIDGDGNATLRSLTLDNASIDHEGHALLESVRSPDFKDGGTLLDGTGFGLWKDKAGRTHVAADIFEARRKAYFAELEVRKFSFSSGDTGYTRAGCKIDLVRKLPGGDYRCFFLAEDDDVRISNDFHVGDQAMARTGNIINKTTQMAQNRYYWRLVVAVDDAPVELEDGRKYHYIDLSNVRGTVTLTVDGKNYQCVGYDTSVDNDEPKAEDKIVQLGSQIDNTRQYAYIVYVSTGQRVDYNGINDYDLGSHAFIIISKAGIELNADYLHMTHGGTGQPLNIVNERGAWYPGAVSGHYDHWSHNNATWLCNIEKGKTTTSEPRDGSPEWIKETYGQKGDPGKDGKGVTNFELLLASGSLLYRDGQEHVATLAVSYIKDGEDVSDKIPLSRLVWSRKSEAPPADDQAWGQRHANAGTSISLDYTDMAGKTDIICKLLDKNDKVAAQGMFSF